MLRVYRLRAETELSNKETAQAKKKPHKNDMVLVSHDKLHNSLLKAESFYVKG